MRGGSWPPWRGRLKAEWAANLPSTKALSEEDEKQSWTCFRAAPLGPPWSLGLSSTAVHQKKSSVSREEKAGAWRVEAGGPRQQSDAGLGVRQTLGVWLLTVTQV